jgi:prephenate dehydratase
VQNNTGRRTVVAHLGPAGTFTHTATLRMWGTDADALALDDVPQVFGAVLDGTADFAVVAVENTVEGVVTASLDQLLFRTGDLEILREVSLPITFTAYRARGASGPATRIGSHPHALAQCRRYVADSGLSVESFDSTAAAVRAAADDPGLIAIGAPGLEDRVAVSVVSAPVEDHRNAFTRFACVGTHDRRDAMPAPTGLGWSVKTTLALTPLSVRAGVLADLCTVFADQNINILSLTSRPLPGFAGAYVFVVTVDAERTSPALSAAAVGLANLAIRIKFLGSYHSDHLRAGVIGQSLEPPVGSIGRVQEYEDLLRLFPGHRQPAALD